MTDGHLVFGETVSRFADSLSPLGAAARIVAESRACVVAMRELSVESCKVRDSKDAMLAQLENWRQRAAVTLASVRDRVGQAELTAQDMRRCIVNMQSNLVMPGIPLAEKRLYLDAIRDFGNILLDQHSQQGVELIQIIDSVLNESGSASPAPLRADVPRRTARTHRSRRWHRLPPTES